MDDHRASLRALQRAAWLLRVSRLLARDEQFAKGTVFAAAFAGGCWRGAVSESRISRWETALTRIPHLAVRRYEELLDLPANSLVSTIDTIYRYASGHGGPSALARKPGEGQDPGVRDLEKMLDKEASGQIMTGLDWDALTSALSALPGVVLVPSATWSAIAGRLLSEMVVADGLAWMQRFEALNRLLGHPSGGQAAVRACADLGSDRASQVSMEAISALDASNHPDAGRQVLSQLVDPVSDLAFYGALLASIRKLRNSHFSHDDVRLLATVVNDILTGPDRHDDVRPLAVEVLRQIPSGARIAQNAAVRKMLTADRALHEVMATGRLATATAAVIVSRVLDSTIAHVARDIRGFRDEMLPTLIDEILFSPVLDVRIYSALLIRASPYRESVAGALASELARPAALRNVELAVTLAGCLRIIGGPAERPLVERLIITPGLAAPITAASAHAIGHVGGLSTDLFWTGAVSYHTRLWHCHRAPATTAVLRDLVYGLGMSRNEVLLHLVRDDTATPSPVRASASWWLGLPAIVYKGARY
jgi:hypothetical protein